MTEKDEERWQWVGHKDDWPEQPERYQKLSDEDLKSWQGGFAGVVALGILAAILFGVVSLFDGGWGSYTMIWMPWTANSDEPRTVDFSFSLECRSLESQQHKKIGWGWNDAVKQYEELSADYSARGWTEKNRQDFLWTLNNLGIQAGGYNTGVRIAFYHGKLDDNSDYHAEGLRILRVTPERIDLVTGWHRFAPAEGFFDRRTGHGMIMRYVHVDANNPPSPFFVTNDKIQQMVIYECEHSPVAKF